MRCTYITAHSHITRIPMTEQITVCANASTLGRQSSDESTSSFVFRCQLYCTGMSTVSASKAVVLIIVPVFGSRTDSGEVIWGGGGVAGGVRGCPILNVSVWGGRGGGRLGWGLF